MNRKTLTAFAAFALLGIIALFALRQPEKGEGAAERARPLAKIDASALDTIVVTKAGTATTLKREGGKIKVVSPVPYPADETAGKAAFAAIEKLELGDLVTENKAKQAEFDVDDAKAVHVIAQHGGPGMVLADLFVGKAGANGTMVRLAGKDEIWQADGALHTTFDKSPADWRDRSITTFTPGDAETITVKAAEKPSVAVLKKSGKATNGDDQWTVVTAAPKIDKLDNSVPTGLVSALSSLKANDFADGATPATTGLDAPSLTVTVGLKGGKNVTLLLGKKRAPDEVFVKTSDAPQVYVCKAFTIERINKRPIEFNDKTLSDIGEADLKEVAVTHGADSYTLVHEGTAWKATKPPKLDIDPGRTPQIGGAFKDWKATSFAEDVSPATTGLAKPQAVVTIKSNKGETMTFKIGNETADKQSVYLQSSKSPDVYLAPKWSTDRLLAKLEDLKQKKKS